MSFGINKKLPIYKTLYSTLDFTCCNQVEISYAGNIQPGELNCVQVCFSMLSLRNLVVCILFMWRCKCYQCLIYEYRNCWFLKNHHCYTAVFSPETLWGHQFLQNVFFWASCRKSVKNISKNTSLLSPSPGKPLTV